MPVRSVLSMPDRSRPNTESLLYALLPAAAAAAGGAVLSFTDPTAPLMRLTASANFCSWITICTGSAGVPHYTSQVGTHCCGHSCQGMLLRKVTHCPPRKPLSPSIHVTFYVHISTAVPPCLSAADHAEYCSFITVSFKSRAGSHGSWHEQKNSRAQQS